MTQNTVSRDKLTEKDRECLEICEKTSEIIQSQIKEQIVDEKAKEFYDQYGKVHYSRDAGYGRAGAKLQRDALCTRGRQAKAPFSNRNLRWHPLVVSRHCPEDFTKMDLDIDGEEKLLEFIPEDDKSEIYLPEDVYQLEKPYCIPREEWLPHGNELKKWSRQAWEQNWCLIPIIEYSSRKWSIETFAVLGLAVATEFFDADLASLYEEVTNYLTQAFKESENFQKGTSNHYPKPENMKEIIQCPLCKASISEYPAELEKRKRPDIWNPPWKKSKRGEGADEAMQLLHAEPLNESEINHNASNVRYGHRWCNVAMTDHSVEQTIEWMLAIVSAHD